jgi:hypothetical protein
MPNDPVVQYAEEMLVWYDKAANRNRWSFYLLKCVQLVLAAAIPVFSLIPRLRGVQPVLSGLAGASLVILEGLRSIFSALRPVPIGRSPEQRLCLPNESRTWSRMRTRPGNFGLRIRRALALALPIRSFRANRASSGFHPRTRRRTPLASGSRITLGGETLSPL